MRLNDKKPLGLTTLVIRFEGVDCSGKNLLIWSKRSVACGCEPMGLLAITIASLLEKKTRFSTSYEFFDSSGGVMIVLKGLSFLDSWEILLKAALKAAAYS
jgi:hypothetical protein